MRLVEGLTHCSHMPLPMPALEGKCKRTSLAATPLCAERAAPLLRVISLQAGHGRDGRAALWL